MELEVILVMVIDVLTVSSWYAINTTDSIIVYSDEETTVMPIMRPTLGLNLRCRNNLYPGIDKVIRYHVPDTRIFWNITWDKYRPENYTHRNIFGKPWADPTMSDRKFKPQWNCFEEDTLINRVSGNGNYSVVNNYPLNPTGRTGIVGRGILGRWGPNIMANVIVTRWKTTYGPKIEYDLDTNLPILQMILIRRKKHPKYHIPSEMVIIGNDYNHIMKRIFLKDLVELEPKRNRKERPNEYVEDNQKIKTFFQNGTMLFHGYIDDGRNTDNAWVELVAMHYHDVVGDSVARLTLSTREKLNAVRWVNIRREMPIEYNFQIIKLLAERMGCHWSY